MYKSKFRRCEDELGLWEVSVGAWLQFSGPHGRSVRQLQRWGWGQRGVKR